MKGTSVSLRAESEEKPVGDAAADASRPEVQWKKLAALRTAGAGWIRP